MELVGVLLIAMAIVAALLVPPYVIGVRRMTRARAQIEHDPRVLTGFNLATGGPRPVLRYLAIVAAVGIAGIVATILISIRIEPLVAGNEAVMIAILAYWSPPILVAVILIGMLISLAATGRSRAAYLRRLQADEPSLPEPTRAAAAEAARQLGGGRTLPGVAGTAAVAAVACLALGLGWVALLFSVAGGAIQCARSSKCL